MAFVCIELKLVMPEVMKLFFYFETFLTPYLIRTIPVWNQLPACVMNAQHVSSLHA